MAIRGNRASSSSWNKAARARAKSKRALSRAVAEALEDRRLLSITIDSFPNLVVDAGAPFSIPLVFGDSLPSDTYDVDVYWCRGDTLDGTESPEHYSVDVDGGNGYVNLPH